MLMYLERMSIKKKIKLLQLGGYKQLKKQKDG